MQDAYIPHIFFRHSQRLRAMMIDNQPWFVAKDFARLIGIRPCRLLQTLEPHEQCSVTLGYTHDFTEEVKAISDVGAYRALFHFEAPERRDITCWLGEVLVPTLHDYHREPDASPRRSFMRCAEQEVGVMRWQNEVWVAWRDLPVFLAANKAVLA